MEIAKLLLIVIGVTAVLAAVTFAVIRISRFYRERYGFSIWSGVFILFPAFMLCFFSAYSDEGGAKLLLAIAAVLCVFTVIRDIMLSGYLYGLIGFIFQLILTFLLIIMIAIVLAEILARAVRRATMREARGAFSNTAQEFRYAIVLLPVFIRWNK